jgi:hypothetical protein
MLPMIMVRKDDEDLGYLLVMRYFNHSSGPFGLCAVFGPFTRQQTPCQG